MSESKEQAVAPSRRMICRRCRMVMEIARTDFSYLTYSFHAELPRCPGCGQVFVPEELVKGRMTQVETELEDK